MEQPIIEQVHSISLFRSVVLGTFRHVDDLRRAIDRDRDIRCGTGATELLISPQFTLEPNATTLRLVAASLADLALSNDALFRDVYDRANQLALALCPPEVGPQLRLQYKDQPFDESLIIGMEPLMNPDGLEAVFVVEHGSTGLRLTTTSAYPCSNWYGSDRLWVFQRND